MEITVSRYASDSNATISHLYINNEPVCEGLEDEYREVKMPGETRIPAGRYKVKPRYEGRHFEQYGKQYAGWHRGSLHITDVPGFSWIMIHIGNSSSDTEGCLLVGMSVQRIAGHYSLMKSRDAYKLFYGRVIDSAERGELWITFIDNDRKKK